MVEVRPIELEARDADQHDAAALPTHARALRDRIVAAGRGRNEHAVDSRPAGEGAGHGQRILAPLECHDVGAKLARKLGLGGIRIDAQHAAAIGTQQLHGEKSQKTQTGDDEALAQSGSRQAYALQSDCAEHRKRRFVVRYVIRYARTQIARYCDELCMRAIRHDALPDGEAANVGADLRDPADVAIAERDHLVELAAYGLQSRQNAVGAHLVEHLTDLLGLLPGLVDPPRAPEFNEHAFGSRRDERTSRLHQQTASCGGTGRHLCQERASVSE